MTCIDRVLCDDALSDCRDEIESASNESVKAVSATPTVAFISSMSGDVCGKLTTLMKDDLK